MKKLLHFTCLTLAALLPAGAHGQSTESPLTGRAAIERIIGNTMVISQVVSELGEIAAVMYFSPDGRAVSQMMANGVANEAGRETGVWSIDDQERLCVVQKGRTLRDRDCLSMVVAGNIASDLRPRISLVTRRLRWSTVIHTVSEFQLRQRRRSSTWRRR